MKQTLFTLLIIFLLSCQGIKQIGKGHDKNLYQINKIESKNEWYFVYAIRHDSTFLIVSKKADVLNFDLGKIEVGNYYNLRLISIIPVIKGVKVIPMNYLDFAGIKLDERTNVNINPKKGIFDVYSAENLKGLYFVK